MRLRTVRSCPWPWEVIWIHECSLRKQIYWVRSGKSSWRLRKIETCRCSVRPSIDWYSRYIRRIVSAPLYCLTCALLNLISHIKYRRHIAFFPLYVFLSASVPLSSPVFS
eukprot:10691_2